MLQLDLNLVPPLEENSVQNDADDDDDVVELSPTTFAQVQSSLRLTKLSLVFSEKEKRERSVSC